MSAQALTRNPTYIYQRYPYGEHTPSEDLMKVLPPLLDDQVRRAVIGASYSVNDTPYFELNEEKTYRYGDRDFSVPSEVVFPGEISGFVFDKIWTGEIDLYGKRFLAMGVGAGVELVLAFEKGARQVVGADIDPASISASRKNFQRHVTNPEAPAEFIVSDLFSAIPPQAYDVICFNGPFGVPVIDNSRLERMAYSGPMILEKFLRQLTAGEFLSPGGEIYIICSNTTDMRMLVRHAIDYGFRAEVLEAVAVPPGHRYEGIVTHYFRLTRS